MIGPTTRLATSKLTAASMPEKNTTGVGIGPPMRAVSSWADMIHQMVTEIADSKNK